MNDFYEIDFLDVESKKSGDAIAMRYVVNGVTTIHVTDGGYQDTGTELVKHIQEFYGSPRVVNHVVLTHHDGDHSGGLRTVLESFDIDALWMLRPWLYADELLPRFKRFTNVENLKRRLKNIYPNIAALEEIANNRGIPIYEPFQGKRIGAFTVMTPSRSRYLDLVVQSERTPEPVDEKKEETGTPASLFQAASRFIRSLWGQEAFSSEETSAENEMSVVQFATLNEHRILLTGDTGRAGLTEAADYAPIIGLTLPGIFRFQVPHHGSRRNVSIETLDRWLGPRLANSSSEGAKSFTAIISSAKADKDHPRKAVVRAMIHRGGLVNTTENGTFRIYSQSAPPRSGWGPVKPESYPEEQEE